MRRRSCIDSNLLITGPLKVVVDMACRIALGAASAFAFIGCVSGPMHLNQISPGQTIAQAMQNRGSLAKYETAIFGLLPVTKRANEQDVVRAAVESAPGQWSTLVQAELTMTQYPYILAQTLCWEAVDRVARKASSHAASRGRR